MIGRVLGHYKILERIGRGGMGEVFVAEDTRLDRKVALKVLPPELSAHEERRRRFEREAKAVAALSHPNIVTIHSVEEAEGVHFITMELVQGKRLSEILPKGGMDLSRFLELAIPIAEGVSAAHEQGITHRDLKPDNIMVTEKGQPKILDFGLAKLQPGPLESSGSQLPTEATTGDGRIVGTLSHMSPEQAEGKAVDPRSDIFSLGVVFYEMLTGRRPFRGDTPASVLSSILKGTPPLVTELKPEVPRDVAKVCRRCLAKDPTRRYQTTLDLRNDLEELKQELGSGALEAPAAPPRRPSRLGVALGLGAMLLTVAAGVVGLLRLRDRAEPNALQVRPLTSFEGWETHPTWSPDGSFVAFSHSGSGNLDIYMMPANGGEAIRLTDTPTDETLPRWSPDNRHIAFVSSRGGSSRIVLVRLFGGTERVLADTGLPPEIPNRARAELGPVPWSPDGQELLYSRRNQNGGIAIWKVAVVSGEETQVTDPPAGSEDQGATWSFDGEHIAFWRRESGRGSLWALPAGGGEARPVLRDEYSNRSPMWSVDGRRLVFVSNRGGTDGLWELEVRTGRLQLLISQAASHASPVISRHGGLAYDSFSHDVDLYRLDVATGAERQLTSHTGEDEEPSVSPDGTKVVYRSNRTGNDEIWLLELASGEERALTAHPRSDSMPDWSPDGEAILFVSDRDGSSELWVMSPEGGALRRVSDQAVVVDRREGSPRWSPDGALIGYLAPTDRGTALWVMNGDGTDARPVLFDVLHFDWYLDTRRVVFSRMGDQGRELRAAHLESGEEVLLSSIPHVEHAVSPDGRAVAFGHSVSHIDQQLFALPLAPPESPGALPRALEGLEQLTEGRGLWHTHNGVWSADARAIIYIRDTDRGDIYVVENYQ